MYYLQYPHYYQTPPTDYSRIKKLKALRKKQKKKQKMDVKRQNIKEITVTKETVKQVDIPQENTLRPQENTLRPRENTLNMVPPQNNSDTLQITEKRATKRPLNDDMTPQTKRRKTDHAAPPLITVKPIESMQKSPEYKVTITSESGFLNRFDACYIIDELGYLIEVESYRFGEFNQRPLFNGRPFYKNCVLNVWCANLETYEWLCNVVGGIRLGNGRGLIVKKHSDVTKMVRCGIPVPDVIDVQSIKRVLRYQNVWAEMHKWVFHHAQLQRNKTFLIVSIPEALMEKIREKNNQLFFKLGTIYVMEEGPNGKFLGKNDREKMAVQRTQFGGNIENNFYSDDEDMGDGSFGNESAWSQKFC